MTSQKSRPAPEDRDEADGKRTVPELHDYMRPGNLFGWLIGFIERYALSRNYRSMIAATPFVVLGICGPLFVWWLKGAPREVEDYQQSAAQALRDGDADAAAFYLKGLVVQRPGDQMYRLQYAMHLIENEQVGQGLQIMKSMIDPGPTGFNPARIWLARQGMGPEPLIPVSQKEIEDQLLMVLQTEPNNVEANRLLADVYLQARAFQQAEARLLKIVEDIPALSFVLVKVQLQLGRSRKQIDFHLANAIRFYEAGLLEDSRNLDYRIAYSEALATDGRTQDAMNTLLEGLRLEESSQLKKSLAMLLLNTARDRLKTSLANRNNSAAMLGKAIELDPLNRPALIQLMMLTDQGAEVRDGVFDPAIAAFSKLGADRSSLDDVTLSRMLTIEGQHDEAIEILETINPTSPKMQIALAAAYTAAERSDEADRLFDEIVREFKLRDEDDLQPGELVDFGNALILNQDYQEARSLLERRMPTVVKAYQESGQDLTLEEKRAASNNLSQLRSVEGRACLAIFRDYLNDESFDDPKAAIAMLDQALRTGSVDYFVLDQLAEQVASQGKFHESADEMLSRLLAGGAANSNIYNLLGLKALQLGNTVMARRNLERAYSLDDSNPIILNNLALALVRDEPDSRQTVERALGLADQVLEVLPQNADGLSTRGEVLVALERWEDARADLELSVKQQAASRNTRELLVKVFEALGEPSVARQHQRLLDELDGKSTEGS